VTTTTTTDPAALARLLADADKAYYDGTDSGLSDAAYDQAKDDLAAAVAADPTLADRPEVAAVLDRPGTTSGDTFDPVRHAVPMLSLDNVFSVDELDAWAAKTDRNAGGHTRFSVTEKLDGISLSLTYRNGRLDLAASRGDGVEGETLTEQARTIANVPERLAVDNPPATVEVRGEVVIPKAAFEQANTDRVASGKAPFANRRNAAAGSMRQKDATVTAARPLAFYAFAIGGWDGDGKPDTDRDALAWIAASFDLPAQAHTDLPATDVADVAAAIEGQRDTLPYDIDGVVVKVEDDAHRATLGATSRAPNWAVALKPKAEQATTTLLDVELQVGRTGRVTPRAVLAPVEVGGVVVSYATLNNAGFVEAKGLMLGDTVIVQRAGDVIPEVVGPVAENRDGSQTPYVFPDDCPVCADPLDRTESADARCVNAECPSQLRSRVVYWASRKIADADGIGEGLIDRLLDAGKVADVGDLLHLTRADLLALDRVGDKLADKVLDNLAGSVDLFNREPARVIASLGIRMNGRGQAKRYIERFGTVNAVLAASPAELETARDIGPERARRLHEGLRTDRVANVLAKYEQAGVDLDSTGETRTVTTDAGQAVEGTPLDGLKVVLTGTLDRGRDDIKADLEALGAKVSGSISGSTDLLIAGEKAGSKIAKAEKAGVTVVGQDVLDRMLAGERP
jgi:DNA ligase (NAD+)